MRNDLKDRSVDLCRPAHRQTESTQRNQQTQRYNRLHRDERQTH